jgi:hypothetical protein
MGEAGAEHLSKPRDLVGERGRFARFAQTELGKLYCAYNGALIAYWRLDGDERVSDRRLGELDARAVAARAAFLEKLMEVAGI